jgi:hypothetical protein
MPAAGWPVLESVRRGMRSLVGGQPVLEAVHAGFQAVSQSSHLLPDLLRELVEAGVHPVEAGVHASLEPGEAGVYPVEASVYLSKRA